jgi:hypothetical protein
MSPTFSEKIRKLCKKPVEVNGKVFFIFYPVDVVIGRKARGKETTRKTET